MGEVLDCPSMTAHQSKSPKTRLFVVSEPAEALRGWEDRVSAELYGEERITFAGEEEERLRDGIGTTTKKESYREKVAT